MGIIWSRLKGRESTKEILRKVQNEIETLEDYNEKTEQTRRKLILNLLGGCTVVYLCAVIILYFYYLPSRFEERLLYIFFFVGSIVIIYLLKSFITIYYKWKLRRNDRKLLQLKSRKEEILNQVMETETYKVAKDIIETFASEQIKSSSRIIKTPVRSTTSTSPTISKPSSSVLLQSGTDVRRRITSPSAYRAYAPRASSPTHVSSSFSHSVPYSRSSLSPRPHEITGVNSSIIASSKNLAVTNRDAPGPPMPRPILPRERSVLDRFIEYLVGDGPSNRYALICRQCESHNGMSLKEEFPYMAFRCAYCFYWNPARKQKPTPPKLESMDLVQSVDQEDSSDENLDQDRQTNKEMEKKETSEEKPTASPSEKCVTHSSTENASDKDKNEGESVLETKDEELS